MSEPVSQRDRRFAIRSFLLLPLLGALAVNPSRAADEPAGKPTRAPARVNRILVVGDSWAAGMTWPFGGVFQPTLDKNGYKNVATIATLRTAIPGSAAAQWASNYNGILDHVKRVLRENPTVEIIFMTLGGNDFNGVAIGRNMLEMPTEDREKLYETIASNIQKVIDELVAIRPNLRVVLCEYDFFNLAANATSPVKLNFHGLTQGQYNGLLVDLGRHKMALARRFNGRVLYVNNWGLHQHLLGDAQAGYGPGQLPAPGGPPDYKPYPGGDPSKPGPKATFANFLVNDGFHPNAACYGHIIENALRQGMGKWLSNPVAEAPQPTSPTTIPVP